MGTETNPMTRNQRSNRRLRDSQRAVTPIIQYALTTALLVGLLSGTIILLSTEVDQTEEKVVDTEGDRIAHEVANAIEEAHGLGTLDTTGNAPVSDSKAAFPVVLKLDLPPDINDASYLIQIDGNRVIITQTGDGGRANIGTAPLPTGVDATAGGGTKGGAIRVAYSQDKESVRVNSNS